MTMPKKKLLIFKRSFLPIPETFVYNQILGCRDDFDIHLMSYSELENTNVFSFDFAPHTEYIHYHSIIERYFSGALRRLGLYKYPTGILASRAIHTFLRKANFSVIHGHFGMYTLKILPFAKRHNIPLIVSFHGFDASAMTRDVVYMSQLRELFDYASKIIVCADYMIDSLKLKSWIDKVSIIPYGVDTAFFSPNLNGTKDSSTIKILHSGRLTEKKGVPDLINVFNELSLVRKNISLEIVGDGVEFEKCKLQVQEMGLTDNVRFYGSQPIGFVKQKMDECDIFVLNSRTTDSGDMEGLPNSILEAMSMSKPVVSTYHAGIPTIITDGQNGLLVPEKNNDLLRDALSSLIDDPELSKRLARAARKKVLQDCTIDKMQQSIASELMSVAR